MGKDVCMAADEIPSLPKGLMDRSQGYLMKAKYKNVTILRDQW